MVSRDPTGLSETAAAAAREADDLSYEHAVCAAGVTVDDEVETALYNGPGDD